MLTWRTGRAVGGMDIELMQFVHGCHYQNHTKESSMGKLISRVELIRRLNVLYDTTTLQRTDEITKAFLDFRFLIMNAPTVEAKEVVHGEWILEEKAGVDYWCCSHCHKIKSEYYAKPTDNFCGNCGCDMRTSAE